MAHTGCVRSECVSICAYRWACSRLACKGTCTKHAQTNGCANASPLGEQEICIWTRLKKKKTQSVKSIYFVIVASVHQTVNLQGLLSKRWLGWYRHSFTFRAESQRKGGSASLSHRTGRRRDIFDDQSDTRLARRCEMSRGSEGRWKRSQVHLHLDPKSLHIIDFKWCPPLQLGDSKKKVGEMRKWAAHYTLNSVSNSNIHMNENTVRNNDFLDVLYWIIFCVTGMLHHL